jgi:hypothetical protein
MIQVDLKKYPQKVWNRLSRSPVFWVAVTTQIGILIHIVFNIIIKKDYFGGLRYFIFIGNIRMVFVLSVALIIFVAVYAFAFLMFPPFKVWRFNRKHPDFSDIITFGDESFMREIHKNGVVSHNECPYSSVHSVYKNDKNIAILTDRMITLFNDSYLNGTPAELEALLKEKCGDKCKF